MQKKIKCAILLLIFLVSPLFARDVTITVIDSDLELPLEGAVVRTREGFEYICNHNGIAVIQASDDRQTVIQIYYPGYEAGVLAVPVTGNSFTVQLRLSGVLQGKELVIEAQRPGASETRTGRSIAVSSRDISQTAEIGIIEDVMNTISLLPGVSYSGFLDAQPSIRGGYPGDMSASLNGFYINNPFFWGGTFSIFDPRMVKHAQLSHGVFSSRFGHTISGLLDITTKTPSYTETQFELSLNSSAANFYLSVPLAGKGGILFMGRVTYYDPVLALAGVLSSVIPELEAVSSFGPVPYIRTITANGNYRFTEKLELNSTAFFGMDGVGINFDNLSYVNDFLSSQSTIAFLFTNYQAFFTSSLSWNPRANMLVKFLAGVGYEEQVNKGKINNVINDRYFTDSFKTRFSPLYDIFKVNEPYSFSNSGLIDQSESNLNIQGRLDFDWELSKYILVSLGAQAMYNHFDASGIQSMTTGLPFNGRYGITDPQTRKRIEEQIAANYQIPPEYMPVLLNNLIVMIPRSYSPNPSNDLLSSSGYILGELNIGNRFTAELGLRVDHFMLIGKNDFTMQSDPVFNPRLNLEYNLFTSSGFFQNINIALGTGLFSSVNSYTSFAEEEFNITKLKPNRSWTSIAGIKFDFPQSISLNIEGYFKYIYDRMYVVTDSEIDDIIISPYFDGEGMIWGIDVMLQKIQSRYWDGWLSYSYSFARYKDPNGGSGRGISGGDRGDDWYYPMFHRHHTLNLVMNFKPVQNINIYTRLGLASGIPIVKRSENGPQSYPVYYFENDIFIERFYWSSSYDDANRTTPSLNLDIKFSLFGSNRNGKTRYELYFAVENILGLLYSAQGNTSFNQYTGEIEEGSYAATFDMPIPIPSFGFRISY